MSAVNPIYVTHARLAGNINVPSNIQAVLDSIIPLINDGTSLKAPEFSNLSTYAVGTFCRHSNMLYVCHTPILIPGEWTSGVNWILMEQVQELFSIRNTALTGTINEVVPATALKPTENSEEYSLDPQSSNPWDLKVDTLVCGSGETAQEITTTDGTADVTTLFSTTNTTNNLDNIRTSSSDSTDAKTYINTAISNACPYELAAFESGNSIVSGQIRTITLTEQPEGNELSVVLDFGNSSTASADALLWLDISQLTESDITLAIEGSEYVYDFVGEGEPFTATKGKKVLFSFTRIESTTVLVCKKEF